MPKVTYAEMDRSLVREIHSFRRRKREEGSRNKRHDPAKYEATGLDAFLKKKGSEKSSCKGKGKRKQKSH